MTRRYTQALWSALGVEGDASQTQMHAGVPAEVFGLLIEIEHALAVDVTLDDATRESALNDVRDARRQLERDEPNRRAAVALLDPLPRSRRSQLSSR